MTIELGGVIAAIVVFAGVIAEFVRIEVKSAGNSQDIKDLKKERANIENKIFDKLDDLNHAVGDIKGALGEIKGEIKGQSRDRMSMDR